jgi:uncharacterized protein YbjT (DUF2867 family)
VKRLFVAGATGAIGRTLMPLAEAQGVDVVGHVRPKSAGKATFARTAVFELSDGAALRDALADRTTVIQLIGTMRKRFGTGDTYESSDVGTTRQLVEAAQDAGVEHLVLLSSVGAGRPVGAYLKAKARAERLVRESGLAWTTIRPSAFHGEGHRAPVLLRTPMDLLGLHRFRPIRVEEVAAALLHCALEAAPSGVALEGRALWGLVEGGVSRFR